MRPARFGLALPAMLLTPCVWPAPARAEARTRFDIPAERLDLALIALGDQAQISIGGVDARLSSVNGRAVRGTMTVRRALATVLQATGFDFVIVDADTVRIIRAVPRPEAPPPPPPKPAKPSPAQPVHDVPVRDIIVTATKQDQGLDVYPGSAHVEKVGGIGLSENQGSAAFVARIPTLTTTNLGPGRNKIFVRGIADSSFSGPTQSTVGLYLGDLRLTYNAPEPDLRLYDIDQVEVIEGPQGTLYGAGALGGIIRILPNPPDLSGLHTSASGGVSTTKDGAAGFDLGGVVNLPIIEDRVALRVVGYRQIEGGYINNAAIGTRNTNRSRIEGGRATLRIRPGNGWTVDLGGVSQNIDTRDSQYGETGLALRTHAAQIAQPHDNDFKAANLVVTKQWNRLSLVSSTGIVKHDLADRFDATGYQNQPGTLVYDATNTISLLTHETRVAHTGTNGSSWVGGISFVRNNDRIDRTLGPPGRPTTLASLRNGRTEIALFGEATQPIGHDWSATLGARLAYAQTIGELLGGTGPEFEPRSRELRILPTAALSWKPTNDLIAFLRYQSGFRSGGISITSGQINSAQRFDSDEINTVELGLRLGGASEAETRHFSGGITGFYSKWTSIQADLISADGLPFTANIGRGQVIGLEANAVWRPSDHVTLDSALFFNSSALVAPARRFSDGNSQTLPNIAKASGRVSAAWIKPLSDTLKLKLDGTVRYVGASQLGTTPPLILEQGETVQTDISARLGTGQWELTLDATNLFDVSGNSFSYGNPFSVGQGRQITPLRPRTIRLGVRVGF